MKIFIPLFLFIFAFTSGSAVYSIDNPANKDVLNKKIDLPKPYASKISLDDAIKKRRTIRKFGRE